MTFFSSDFSNRHYRPLKHTLVDGEMVIDISADGMKTVRYLIYDIIAVNGDSNIKEKPFTTRMELINSEIIEPRKTMEPQFPFHQQPICIDRKDFWVSKCTKALLSEKFKTQLRHKEDGLIFQPINAAYQPGTCYKVLKWKPLSCNSVDFHLSCSKKLNVSKRILVEKVAEFGYLTLLYSFTND